MAKSNRRLSIVRIIVELLALALVIFLTKNHKLQMWLIIFLAGVIVSFFAGRLFCGWICPMNTIFRGINYIYSKLKIKRITAPKILKNNIVRIAFLLLYIGGMVFVKVTGLHVNLLLYIILFSVLITLFINEEFWHHYLCPFGTILSFTSRTAGLSLQIDEDNCISCGKCQKVCPSQSIRTLENTKRQNQANECLLCFQCIDACPKDVCAYKKKEKTHEKN